MAGTSAAPRTATSLLLIPPGVIPPREALRLLRRLSRAPWLALPPVALPDLHCKPQMESPSSLVTATDDALVLGLTSPSAHCGIALALTHLTVDFATPERLERLFAHLVEHLNPQRTEPVLDEVDLDLALLGGIPAWREREQSVNLLPAMERAAAVPPSEGVAGSEILRVVPSWIRPLARREFGLIGTGNHFLELQAVDELLEPAVAAAWGIEAGQLVVMAHADSGHLGAALGRLFAHRRKRGRRPRWQEWRVKVPYHLQRTSCWTHLPERARLFWPGRWVAIPAESETGQLCRWALAVAANYAAAGRLALWAEVARALSAAGGPARIDLLWDAPHNGIWREPVDGRMLWLHRHNAARVVPGQPALLPGCAQTSSLLCIGGAGAQTTLYSASHGAGRTAVQLGRPLEGAVDGTRIYDYHPPSPQLVPRLSDDGLWAVSDTLAQAAIIRPVARLRPLATLRAQR